MTEYLVTHRRDNHNDEWENEYTELCIRDEHGRFVYAAWHDEWAELVVIPSRNVITWAKS